MNRNWHAVTSEYNTLYNGQVAFDKGVEELNYNYEDNFWDILPIERLYIDEEILLPDSIRNKNFGYAEEKAVKAIQRHSMLIKGKEKNPQIDEAYLLLGQSRYFDQRFIPALDAFNYVLHKYPASNNINKAQIWREKTNLRLENNKLAVKNLKRIISKEKLDDQIMADANATLAQAYINLNHKDSAAVVLRTAAEFTKKNEEKGRYYYILGQLYNSLGEQEQANAAFDEVIDLKRKSPRIYMINAYVEKARNYENLGGSNEQLGVLLHELENDRENRPFLDKVYFQLAEYYQKKDSTDLATSYYNKSLRAPSSDKYLKSINYEILADIYFDKANYQLASKYFDSTLMNMSSELREFRTIKKKRENLEDVILYRDIADRNDSIMKLVNLSKEEQIAYFKTYTDGLKEEFKSQAAEGIKEMAIAQNRGPAIPMADVAAGPANSFYFYNPIRLSNGAKEFFTTWGSRKLGDNWRTGNTGINDIIAIGGNPMEEVDLENDPRFDPMTYVRTIPSETKLVDSINKDRNFAYYQLGIIYKEKFKEYEMAQHRFETLLENSPEDNLILPSKYYLYKIFEATGQEAKMSALKAEILAEYPDSRYANFILNPGSLKAEENLPAKLYDEVYKGFQEQQYDRVINKSNEYIAQFTGEEIVPKFELLKAMAAGRLYGIEAYKDALNYVALNYPQTMEGKKAQNLYNTAIPQMANLDFTADSLSTNYKILYTFKSEDKSLAYALKQKIEEALKELNYKELSTSVDVYSPTETFVVVHGLSSKSKSEGFAELLKLNKSYKVENKPIVISAENYRIAQINKNLNTYLIIE